MSLADIQENAKREQVARNRKPDGLYRVKILDWELRKSAVKKIDMYIITTKIIKIISLDSDLPEGREEEDYKGKKFALKFFPKYSFSLDGLLDIIKGCGVDLNNYEGLSDIPRALDDIEDAGWPKADLRYEHPEEEQHPKVCELSNIEKVIFAEEPNEEEEEVEPVAKKKKSIKAPGA